MTIFKYEELSSKIWGTKSTIIIFFYPQCSEQNSGTGNDVATNLNSLINVTVIAGIP